MVSEPLEQSLISFLSPPEPVGLHSPKRDGKRVSLLSSMVFRDQRSLAPFLVFARSSRPSLSYSLSAFLFSVAAASGLAQASIAACLGPLQ